MDIDADEDAKDLYDQLLLWRFGQVDEIETLIRRLYRANPEERARIMAVADPEHRRHAMRTALMFMVAASGKFDLVEVSELLGRNLTEPELKEYEGLASDVMDDCFSSRGLMRLDALATRLSEEQEEATKKSFEAHRGKWNAAH